LYIDAVEPERVFVNYSVDASVSWSSDRLSPFWHAAPVPELAQQVDDESLERSRRHLSHTIKEVGLQCPGEYLIAAPYLFLGSSGHFGCRGALVRKSRFGETSRGAPLAPLHIAEEAPEKLHIDFRRSLRKNLKPVGVARYMPRPVFSIKPARCKNTFAHAVRFPKVVCRPLGASPSGLIR
jgi:hypothetical protein